MIAGSGGGDAVHTLLGMDKRAKVAYHEYDAGAMLEAYG